MSIEALLNSGEIIWLIKITTLVILAIYIIFTFIILNQIRVMNSILKETFASTVLLVTATVNFILPLSLFLIALVIL
jgi:hypothetical protein